MPPVTYAPYFHLGLARINRHLRQDNPEAAKRAVKAIKKKLEILVTHPLAGAPIEDGPPEYRQLFIPFGDSGYVVRYRIGTAATIVLAVRHSREAGY